MNFFRFPAVFKDLLWVILENYFQIFLYLNFKEQNLKMMRYR